MKGLRKADVHNMTADDVADSLQIMNATFDKVIDDMDRATVDVIIQKVGHLAVWLNALNG